MRRVHLFAGAGIAAAMVLLAANPVHCQGRYESPPTFTPAQALPPDLVGSPYHKIVGRVPVDNFLDQFQMQTTWGTFNVNGIELLRLDRGSEVEFVTLMTFDSIRNVIDFQGSDYARAYVPDAAQKVLKRWDPVSDHYEVVEKRTYG